MITRRGLLGSAAGLAVAATMPTTAWADAGTIERWIAANTVRLKTADPDAPLDDLRGLRVGGAVLVGLGEPGHNLAEITTLKHRVLRLLIERHGFRTLIWEDDWSLGLLIDEYLQTGDGDLDALVGQLSTGAWQNQQVVDVLTWLRRYNLEHPHRPVRFVGAEHYGTRRFVYDRLSSYLAEHAPDQFDEAESLITELKPPADKTIGEYAKWYFDLVADKGPFLRAAKRLRAIVDGLRRPAGGRRHSVVKQMARQIENFYLHYSLPRAEIPSFRDLGSAGTIRWWLEHSRTRSVYWAASAHTSRAAEVQVSAPWGPLILVPAGSHLARWYGDRYRVIGYAFDHGTYRTEEGIIELPRPLPEWYEHRFRDLDHEQSLLELDGRAPGAVKDWLAAPFRARGYPDQGADSTATGGTLADWFDVIIHRRTVSPVDPYPPG
jgi:erythromycin esterase